MGTDVYLSWDKQTKDEEDRQITGFNITQGDAGYLRASIGMVKENEVLSQIFPHEFWHNDEDGGLPYDFSTNFDRVDKLLKKYLSSELFNIPMDVQNGEKKITFGKYVKQILLSMGFQDKTPNKRAFQWSVTWANSVYAFFRLGLRKQEEKSNPKVSISW